MAGKPWFIYNWGIAGITNENKLFKLYSSLAEKLRKKETKTSVLTLVSTHENMSPAVSSTTFNPSYYGTLEHTREYVSCSKYYNI